MLSRASDTDYSVGFFKEIFEVIHAEAALRGGRLMLLEEAIEGGREVCHIASQSLIRYN
jgi:hypothetical protein